MNNKIRLLLNLKNISLNEAARLMKVPSSSLSRFLNTREGNIKSESLIKLLLFLGIDVEMQLKKSLNEKINGYAEVDNELGSAFSAIYGSLDDISKLSLIDSFLSDSKYKKDEGIKKARETLKAEKKTL
ncbi:MAG: helix-turn-helix transcriptional regulator [Bdellovibrionaceae bacterium]|jgi:transcriptional regulator with XRE-family HTH domain|nr:helix-turn-helix transcriptional regulator [Pseudobdellovibrionaceae bacterium]